MRVVVSVLDLVGGKRGATWALGLVNDVGVVVDFGANEAASSADTEY